MPGLLLRQDAIRDIEGVRNIHLETAAEGGDFQSIFGGKFVVFKPTEAARALKQTREVRQELSMLPRPRIDINLGIMDRIRTLIAQIRGAILNMYRAVMQPVTALIESIKAWFQELLRIFDPLREAMQEAFAALMALIPEIPNIFEFIEFLFDFIADLMIDFIGGIIEAITPFVGSVVACGKMLRAWATTTKAAIKRFKLANNAVALNPANRFSEASRRAIVAHMQQELNDRGKDCALATGNATISVVGLMFTLGIGSTVAGILAAVTKLALHVSYAVRDYVDCKRANSALWRMRGKSRGALNPAELFNAAPILAAHYIITASHNALIATTDNTNLSRVQAAEWDRQHAELAEKLFPVKQYASEALKKSRLCLVSIPHMPSPKEVFQYATKTLAVRPDLA